LNDHPQAGRALELAKLLRATAGQGEAPAESAPPDRTEVGELLGRFDAVVTDPDLVSVARSPFEDGYYAYAVEEAAKYINNLVKDRSGQHGRDGASLMTHVFSSTKPILRLNPLKTQSQQDQQVGYMQILQGLMTGIRNPRAHEHQYLDEPHVALEILALCNHLARVVKAATRTRNRAPKAP
jgi:uncharacterized protein (TIGR02391 family)